MGHSSTYTLAVIPAHVGTWCICLPFFNSGRVRHSRPPPLKTAATNQPLVVCKEWELSVLDSRIPPYDVIHTHTYIQCSASLHRSRRQIASMILFKGMKWQDVRSSIRCQNVCCFQGTVIWATYVAYDIRCTGLGAWCVGISYSLPTHAPLCTKTGVFNCYCMSTNQIPLWCSPIGSLALYSSLSPCANGIDPPALLVHIVLDMVTVLGNY